jgi:hypothetical protein
MLRITCYIYSRLWQPERVVRIESLSRTNPQGSFVRDNPGIRHQIISSDSRAICISDEKPDSVGLADESRHSTALAFP